MIQAAGHRYQPCRPTAIHLRRHESGPKFFTDCCQSANQPIMQLLISQLRLSGIVGNSNNSPVKSALPPLLCVLPEGLESQLKLAALMDSSQSLYPLLCVSLHLNFTDLRQSNQHPSNPQHAVQEAPGPPQQGLPQRCQIPAPHSVFHSCDAVAVQVGATGCQCTMHIQTTRATAGKLTNSVLPLLHNSWGLESEALLQLHAVYVELAAKPCHQLVEHSWLYDIATAQQESVCNQRYSTRQICSYRKLESLWRARTR